MKKCPAFSHYLSQLKWEGREYGTQVLMPPTEEESKCVHVTCLLRGEGVLSLTGRSSTIGGGLMLTVFFI